MRSVTYRRLPCGFFVGGVVAGDDGDGGGCVVSVV
ncbi:hypothetical protein Acr_00g0103010 [Actinidia rufa]|uniref:Uncharacterized protein n=1 Tax=Actinidia rufa TaxID=165716 RepID=A0A7J0E1L0_9ERIC|nr:hypothetical protein Acr_00g0103010 [Actinidia rufa]